MSLSGYPMLDERILVRSDLECLSVFDIQDGLLVT